MKLYIIIYSREIGAVYNNFVIISVCTAAALAAAASDGDLRLSPIDCRPTAITAYREERVRCIILLLTC